MVLIICLKIERNRRSYDPFKQTTGDRYENSDLREGVLEAPVGSEDAEAVMKKTQYIYEGMDVPKYPYAVSGSRIP